MNFKSIIASAILVAFITGCASNGGSISQVGDTQECIKKQELSKMATENLKKIEENNKELRAIASDIQSYTKWLNTYLADYSKYIETAGTFSPIIKTIPLPYAAQAGDFVKFGSKLTVSLTNTAIAVDSANKSIDGFENMLKRDADNKNIYASAKFADNDLTNSTNELIDKTQNIKNLSKALVVFAESVDKVTGSGQDVLMKAKSILGSAQPKLPQEQSLVLKKLELLTTKLSKMESIAKTNAILSKRAIVYSELATN